VLIALLAAAELLFQYFAGADGDQDADTVYCLAPAHQAGLVNAAADLDLIASDSTTAKVHVDGSVISLPRWKARHPSDFQQACDAYAAPAFSSSGSSSSGSNGIGALLNILLPVAVGALITLMIDARKEDSTRRWAQADALRESWRDYRAVLDAYLQAKPQLNPAALPEDDAIDPPRRDLARKLRFLHLQHRRSKAITELTDELGPAGQFGLGFTDGWPAGNTPEILLTRRRRAEELRKALETFDTGIETVSERLERRAWSLRRQ
jgi:hypothetical protein